MARPAGRAAPTLESVAALAGVSRATAGRVLSGSTTVGTQAREAVLAAAAELSYVTNRAARSLMTRRSDSIAFVIAEPEERFFSDPHFSLMLQGAHAAVADHDVQLVFSVLHAPAQRERFERFAGGGYVDGVILASVHGDDTLPRHLVDAGVPVILSGRPFTPVEGLACVDVDNAGGARAAVALLVERGRRRIATITGPSDLTATIDRSAGFEVELAAQGLPGHGTFGGDFTFVGGRQAMRELLARDPRPDGVFAANDLMAQGVCQVLREQGRRVPEDVAVVGFDDSSVALTCKPQLTTVRQPVEEMAAMMAQLLQECVEGTRTEPTSVIFEPELVVRESA
jgi:DNA-binding LacI/PurR family transcriptional regulator